MRSIVAALALFGCASEPDPVDLVVRAGRNGPDAPPAAIVVDGGVVTAILDDAADAPPATRVIDGDYVTAGFVDAHAHPAGLGSHLAELDLSDAENYAATLARVANAPGSGWLLGRGWDQNDWTDGPPGSWPLAADLERAAPARPIALRRIDGHAVWLSPSALIAAGISKDTPDPPGGRIIRDADGHPTGVLVDTAVDLVSTPTPSDEEHYERLKRAIAAIAEVGLTGVHDMGVSDAGLARYERLQAEGGLPIRIWVYADPDSEAAKRLIASGPWGDGHLRVVGVKAYADGALGSRGALLSAPYADAPDELGNRITSAADLAALATALTGAGAQLAVHAIGDQAVTDTLDAFAAAKAAHPDRVVRHRVEHAQVVRPEDRPRFVALGVVASMQPTHATSDMPWAPARLGPERVAWAYTWRSLLDLGVPLAFGSDFPVEGVDPALGLWAATRRTDRQGQPPGGWTPAETVPWPAAIAGFTSGAAWAVGEEGRLGVIRVGQPADLTVWQTSDATKWRATATIVDGVVVWPPPPAPTAP